MTDGRTHAANGEPSSDGAGTGPSRRRFLKGAAATGAVGAGVGSALIGTATGAGIPTPRLTRDGNLFRDPEGNRVVLRGVNVVDPARAKETAWRRAIPRVVEHATDASRDWYSRVVRVPIQPGDVAAAGKGHGSEPKPVAFERSTLETYLETYLDPVVEKCAELGVYCIVDYHRHRDQELKYTDSALHDEVTMFWETVAPRYAGDSHVLFEVYNEPISPFVGFRERSVNVDILDDAAEETWLTWRDAAQPWVDTIREGAPQNPVLIGSPSWSQWTYWAQHDEFAGDNLGYTGHVYAHPNLRPLGDYFGDPAEEVPVFMTEFGWEADGNEYFQGTVSEEGEQFVNFFEEYDQVSWTVWCFDHIWSPPMFSKPNGGPDVAWNLLSGEKYHGKFFRDYLAEKRDADLPAGEGPGTDRTTGEGPGSETTRGSATTTTTTTTTSGTDGTPGRVGSNTALPSDPDDDGLYEDVNGNARQDIADAVDLFQHRESVDARYFDFTESGDTSIGDAVSLFRENT